MYYTCIQILFWQTKVLGNYYALILLLERHLGARKGYALSKKQIGKFGRSEVYRGIYFSCIV